MQWSNKREMASIIKYKRAAPANLWFGEDSQFDSSRKSKKNQFQHYFWMRLENQCSKFKLEFWFHSFDPSGECMLQSFLSFFFPPTFKLDWLFSPTTENKLIFFFQPTMGKNTLSELVIRRIYFCALGGSIASQLAYYYSLGGVLLTHTHSTRRWRRIVSNCVMFTSLHK